MAASRPQPAGLAIRNDKFIVRGRQRRYCIGPTSRHMVTLSKATLFVWWLPVLLEILIAIAMYVRRLYKDLPIFFTYILYHIFRAFALLAAISLPDRHVYFIAYWSAEVVSVGLGLGVIFELFRTVLKPYRSVHKLGNWLFAWACMLVLLVAVISGLDHGHEAEAIMAGIFTLERCVRVVQAGLLLFLFVFSRSLNLSWRNCVIGIAIGFALFVGTELAVVTFRLQDGRPHDSWYQLLKPVAFNCAVLTWVLYVLQPEPLVAPSLASEDGSLNELQKWNLALSRFI